MGTRTAPGEIPDLSVLFSILLCFPLISGAERPAAVPTETVGTRRLAPGVGGVFEHQDLPEP
jgi:hypothetical protein